MRVAGVLNCLVRLDVDQDRRRIELECLDTFGGSEHSRKLAG